MQTRWNQINKVTLKFNGIFTQVVKVIKSGWNQEMYEEEAKRLYLDEMLTKKKSDEKSSGIDSNGENKENKSADCPIGNKAAKQARAEENEKTSFEEMNATSMQIRALAHRDAITFNIMKQVPDCDASKEWFTMKAEEFVRELKEEAEKKRKWTLNRKEEFLRRQIKKMQGKSWNSVPLCLILENEMEKRR